MLELYHNDMSVCAQKVRLVLEYKGIPWQGHHLNLRAGDQFKPSFRQINAKGLVPVLVDDGAVITESNAIIEYLEDTVEGHPLRPVDAALRAKMRGWLIRLDAGLHEHVAAISFCVAFRHQLLQRYPDTEQIERFIDQIPDPGRAGFMRDVLPNGVASKRFSLALYSYNQLLADMDDALQQRAWLAGDQLSLADFSYVPYIDRLDQLQLSFWWRDRPAIADWLERMRGLPAYGTAIQQWNNNDYLQLMAGHGRESAPEVQRVLAALVTEA
ncbi:glutathione S-transferase family protein [Parahaliea maris]|nr:glutathione S-transferase family protein [Parahaliea maris]